MQNHAYFATIILAVLGFMTQGAIALRIYARKTLASALGVGIDDYLIVAASLIIAYVQIAGTIGKPSLPPLSRFLSAPVHSPVASLFADKVRGPGVRTW